MAEKKAVIKRVGAGFVASVALTVVAVLGGAPAQAASWQDAQAACPDGSTCIWLDSNFTTHGDVQKYLGFQYFIPDFGGYNYRYTVTNAFNSSSSFFNDGNWDDSFLFTGTYRTGYYISGPPKSYANFGPAHNDNFESGYFRSCLDGVC